jgi:hypothetical protein
VYFGRTDNTHRSNKYRPSEKLRHVSSAECRVPSYIRERRAIYTELTTSIYHIKYRLPTSDLRALCLLFLEWERIWRKSFSLLPEEKLTTFHPDRKIEEGHICQYRHPCFEIDIITSLPKESSQIRWTDCQIDTRERVPSYTTLFERFLYRTLSKIYMSERHGWLWM